MGQIAEFFQWYLHIVICFGEHPFPYCQSSVIHSAVYGMVSMGTDGRLQILCQSHDDGVYILDLSGLCVGLGIQPNFPDFFLETVDFPCQSLHVRQWLSHQMFRPCGWVWCFSFSLCFDYVTEKMDSIFSQIGYISLFL